MTTMDWEVFRAQGHALVDWIADYHRQVESMPVLAQVEPGEIRAQLPPHPPQAGESFAAMMDDVERIILPGITHWQSPNFFAFFPANASGPAILGELLSAGLGVQGMLWATSPACTELETLVLDWVAQMLDLPQSFYSPVHHAASQGGGVIQDSASSATLCALIAAREQTRARTDLSPDAGSAQDTPPQLCIYTSTQGHSSIEKAVRIAGLGRNALRLIAVDADFAMRPDALVQAIEADLDAGRVPCMVAATAGTTSSLAFDPLPRIGEICRHYGIWLHVDGAMAGSAAICPEFRGIHAGLEAADSYCFNPHKWLLTNFDCNCFYVARRKALIEALSILPEYLRNQATESGAVIDYRDWQIPLGRRFRALKLWFVIRHYGVAGLQTFIRGHVALAQEFAGWVRSHPDFRLAVEPALNLVCFYHVGGDDFNARLLAELNRSGALYLTHTKLQLAAGHDMDPAEHDEGAREIYTLRLCIGQAATERRHVEAAWQQICTVARRLQAE